MVALFGEHRTHRARHRRIREDFLHLELVLADEIDDRREDDIVEKVVKRDVERIEDMVAELHRQQLVHRFFGDVGMARFSPARVVVEHPKHLIPVPQLLGHDPEDGDFHLIRRRLFERQPVLLNRSELGGSLRADDVASGVEHVADHLAGALEAWLPGQAAEVDGFGIQLSDFGEQLIRRLGRVVLAPVLLQKLELGEVFLLPADQRLVVLRGNGFSRIRSQSRTSCGGNVTAGNNILVAFSAIISAPSGRIVTR